MPDDREFLDYYELLAVATNADSEAIRTAFIAKAKLHHPDVGGSTELMQQYTRAYRSLMSRSSRKAYDLVHAFHTGTSEVQYREYGEVAGDNTTSDLTDDEIDDFLDKIYAEYHYMTPVKQSLFSKIKNAL